MKTIKRLASPGFWYDLSLKATIAGTLRKSGRFNPTEIKTTLAGYRQLLAANRHRIQDVPSEYHLSWSSMILATYRVLLAKGLPANQAIARTEHLIFTNMGAESVAGYITRALDRAKDRFAYIVGSSKNQEKAFFGASFQFLRLVDNGRSYHLRVKRCFYLDFFAANAAPELMAIACKWDLISWAKGIDPRRHGVKFNRPRTLGLDGVDCEFDFDRVD